MFVILVGSSIQRAYVKADARVAKREFAEVDAANPSIDCSFIELAEKSDIKSHVVKEKMPASPPPPPPPPPSTSPEITEDPGPPPETDAQESNEETS